MPVTDVRHDLDSRTLTIVAEFAAPVDRIWPNLRRPPPPGENLGATGIPGHGGGARPARRWPDDLLHDRSRRRATFVSSLHPI